MYVAVFSSRRQTMLPTSRKPPPPLAKVTVWRYMLALLAVFIFLVVAVEVYTEGRQISLTGSGQAAIRFPTSTTALRQLAHLQTLSNPSTHGTSTALAKYKTYNPLGKHNHSLILYAKQRTGSSFVSEIFNHHPDVFYVFEPLNAADWTQHFYNGSAANILDSVFSCDIRHIEESADNEKRKNWVRAEMFCHLEGQNAAACKLRHTSPQHWLAILSANCKKREYIASKLISLPRLSLLEPYLLQGARVVVLVRDPRGVITSRMRIHNTQSAASAHNMALTYCLPLLTDLSYLRQVRQLYPKQTEDMFLLLRYEDMAANTLGVTRQILAFFGLRFDSRVRRWALGVEAGSPVQEETTYSTKRRNATQTSQGWKLDRHIKQRTILAIEDACRPLMRTLGYKFVHPHNTHHPVQVDQAKNYVGTFDLNAFYTSSEPLLP